MNKTVLGLLLTVPVALAGCGGSTDTLGSAGSGGSVTAQQATGPGNTSNVPDHVRERAENEMAGQGRIEQRRGCEARTVGQLLASQQERSAATGAPIESWLSESDPNGRVWVCLFTGTFPRAAGDEVVNARVIVPDRIAGAPQIGIDFGPDAT